MRNGRRQIIEPGEGYYRPQGTHSGYSPTRHTQRQVARWSARRKRAARGFLCALLLGIGTLIILSTSGLQGWGQVRGALPGTAPGGGTPANTSGGSSGARATVTVRTAQVRTYPFPTSRVGLMQPAVDARGHLWVGEMYANRFARLDSQTGVVTTWRPPNGKNGLMTTTGDAQGNLWFVEQNANYIGRFDPTRQTFRTFPLDITGGRSLGPQDLQFDSSGNLWFTAPTGAQIGRLDPTTGAVQIWSVPPPRAGSPSTPFSLTVLPNGQIWFGYLTGGAVGNLDPATAQVTLYRLANPQAAVFSLAHDTKGQIWFTEMVPGVLGMIDSTTGKVTEQPVPAVSGNIASLYRLVVTPDDEVWFVNSGANALVRYTPDQTTYTFFQLPASSEGSLYGLTGDGAGRLWFTTSGQSTNIVGEMSL